jgi:tRNA pseudouridine38-40 synthase
LQKLRAEESVPANSANLEDTSEQLEVRLSRRLSLVVEYDGTNYKGFQLQDGHPTIQGEIEGALTRFTGESIRIRSASRTDSGAHARGQVVDFLTNTDHPAEYFPRALNYYLPRDIVVQSAGQVPLGFNSRREAVSRTYRYHILNRAWPAPLRRHTHLWIRETLEVDKMAAAAKWLVGVHDFRPLAPSHPADKSAVRQVYRWDVWTEDDTVIIESEANGFLRHQIRKANSLLVEAGKGRRPISIVRDTLSGIPVGKKDVPVLPAHGLCLMNVSYSSSSTEACHPA